MSPGRRRAALALLSAASFLAVVDTTVVSIALPTVAASLDMSAAAAAWILTAYSLAFGALLLPLGRVADRVGRRRLFCWGLVAFAIASLAAGLATSGAVLVAARFVQGAASAAFVPASLALVTAVYPDRHARSRALGVYGAMASVGFVVGMVGGGFVTALAGWRWIFLGLVPVSAAAAIAGVRLPASADVSRDTSRPRLLAGLVLVGSLCLTVTGLSGALSLGVGMAAVAAGVGMIIALVRHERGNPDALVPWDVVGSRVVAVPNLALTLQSMVGIAWLYLLTLAFQAVRGADPIRAGLLFAPMTLGSIVAAVFAARIVTALGTGRAAVLGLGGVVLGVLVMLVGVPAERSVVVLIVGSVLGESGFMISNVGLTLAATSALPSDRGALAAALINSAAQLGGALGLALTGGVITAVLASGAALETGLQAGLFACVLFGIGAAGLASMLAPNDHRVHSATGPTRLRGG